MFVAVAPAALGIPGGVRPCVRSVAVKGPLDVRCVQVSRAGLLLCTSRVVRRPCYLAAVNPIAARVPRSCGSFFARLVVFSFSCFMFLAHRICSQSQGLGAAPS